jgi:hypothetical protein
MADAKKRIFMKKLSCMIAIASMSFVLAAQAQRQAPTPYATTDPLLTIYRVSGVSDDGGAENVGMATVFHCSNTSGVTERLQFQIRQYPGTIISTKETVIGGNATVTAMTHQVTMFGVDMVLSPTVKVDQGFARISASAKGVYCSAMIVDASAFVPEGIALHMARVNAPTGVQE